MSPAAPPGSLQRLAIFAALAAFVSLEWASLLADPPLARVAAILLVVLAGALALILFASDRHRRRAPPALAAVGVVVITLAGSLLAAGVPLSHLLPGGWDDFGSSIRSGLEGLEDVDYPYRGDQPWSRIALLAALPLALTAAASAAFWPRRDRRSGPRLPALAILVGLYATAIVNDTTGRPLLRGAALFALIACWLWLPGLRRRHAVAAFAIVMATGAVAVPIASALDGEDPWIDHSNWDFDFSGKGEGETFEWDHSYGPIDWPRTGKRLLRVRSPSAHYWRTAVLDAFDGVRWRSSGAPETALTELPGGTAGFDALRPDWVEWVRYEIDSLRSPEVVSAGAVDASRGSEIVLSPSGLVPSDGALREGDSYALRTYVPDPATDRLRRSSTAYTPLLTRYTAIAVPVTGRGGELGLRRTVPVPLWGEPRAEADSRLADSPYAAVAELARSWSAEAATPYGAVVAIRDRLRGEYTYSETPPRHRYPLRAFLLGDRLGYCQQFSGAMTLMLRMIGIPSRVASGFSPGTREGRKSFVVRDYDAHSWVEVYFNGIGWVPFDPTPAAAPAQLQSQGPAPAPARQPPAPEPAPGSRDLGSAAASAGKGSGSASAWPLIALLAVLLLAALAAVALRRRRWLSLSPAARADAQLREFEAALRRLGHRVPGGTTLARLERRLGRGRPRSRAYAETLRASRFAPGRAAAPTLADRRHLRSELSSGGGPGRRLRGLLAFPPGAPSRAV
jgi:transglutaminase-like putative cysteine protease